MELSRTKRLVLGLTLIAVVILSFVGGYLFARVKPSNYVSNNSKNEIISILDEYYYKEYDKDKFDSESLKSAVKSLDDPYTYLYTLDSNNVNGFSYGYGIGTTDSYLGLKVSKVYKNSPADKAGLATDDIIIGVDNIKMGKNSIDEISNYLKDTNGETTLYFLRNNKEFSVKIKKGEINSDIVKYKLIGSIGYIKIESFDTGASKKFKEALTTLESSNITGLIIDVRNNPGGSASEVSNILRNFLTGKDAFLYLKSEKSSKTDVYRATDATKKTYDIKVLMNKNSASASEVFALVMNRVMNYDLIGDNSFGKNVFQTDVEVKSMENTYLHVTLGNWFGPNEEMITNDGITPTIKVMDNKYVASPIDNNTYELDMANDDVKNICYMLNTMYEQNLRVDGYFDSNLKDYLLVKYETDKLDYNTKKKIFDEYYNYVNDEANDLVLNKALSLFE